MELASTFRRALFTMDIYRTLINKNASEKQLVRTGRITALTVLAIAVIIAPQLRNLDQAFQFIQDFTGYVTPGVVAIFLAGLFWKRNFHGITFDYEYVPLKVHDLSPHRFRLGLEVYIDLRKRTKFTYKHIDWF